MRSVEVALNLNVDPRHADQMIRGSVVLPNGTGKNVRVAVFAKGAKVDEAKEAGADIVGSTELLEQIQEGNINFDTVIATPDMMGKQIGRGCQEIIVGTQKRGLIAHKPLKEPW